MAHPDRRRRHKTAALRARSGDLVKRSQPQPRLRVNNRDARAAREVIDFCATYGRQPDDTTIALLADLDRAIAWKISMRSALLDFQLLKWKRDRSS